MIREKGAPVHEARPRNNMLLHARLRLQLNARDAKLLQLVRKSPKNCANADANTLHCANSRPMQDEAEVKVYKTFVTRCG